VNVGLPARILIGLALLAIAFTAGWRVCNDRRDAQLLEQERADRALADQQRKLVEALALELANDRAKKKAKDRIITQEVTRYVEVTPAPDRVVLPGAWRVRHDAAATGDPGLATGRSAGVAVRSADPAAGH